MAISRKTSLLVLVLVGGALLGKVPLRSEAPKEEEAKKLTGAEIADKLESRLNYPGLDDPKTTLGEALDALSKRTDIPIEINVQAFANAELGDADKHLLVADKPLPAMKASLARVLRKILDRIPSSSRGLIVIRDESIELTTAKAFSEEIGRGGNDMAEMGATPTVPLVYAVLEKRPLEQALRSLADRTGFSIILDARVADKAKASITATLKNVPLDTAVRLLADMAELRSVLIDNTLYVTSLENADRLIAEQNRRQQGGFGLDGAGPLVQPANPGNTGNLGGPGNRPANAGGM